MPDHILPHHKNLLIEEVLIQTKLACLAFENFSRLISSSETQQLRVGWLHMQSFLGHTAMISKLMSPPSKSNISRERATVLRSILEVEDGSPVLCRNARNNVEHLDERLDAWILSGANRYLETAFDNRDAYDFLTSREDSDKSQYFIKRVYLRDENIFISQGREDIEEIDISSLVKELSRIEDKAEKFLAADKTVVRIYPR